MAQRRGQQRVREMPLRGGHFRERKSVASFGNEMPIDALVAFQLEHGFGLLFGRQGRQKIVGRLGHRRSRCLCPSALQRYGKGLGQHEDGNREASGGFHPPKTMESELKRNTKSKAAPRR